MSLHNLATVFGPTLLRPSEKDSKIPANPTQPITMTDSWSLEVMSQVKSWMCHSILWRHFLGKHSPVAGLAQRPYWVFMVIFLINIKQLLPSHRHFSLSVEQCSFRQVSLHLYKYSFSWRNVCVCASWVCSCMGRILGSCVPAPCCWPGIKESAVFPQCSSALNHLHWCTTKFYGHCCLWRLCRGLEHRACVTESDWFVFPHWVKANSRYNFFSAGTNQHHCSTWNLKRVSLKHCKFCYFYCCNTVY